MKTLLLLLYTINLFANPLTKDSTLKNYNATNSLNLLSKTSKQNTFNSYYKAAVFQQKQHLTQFYALKEVKNAQMTDSLTTKGKPLRYGIRLGVDISKPIRSLFDKNYTGFEVVADYRIKKHTYLATELGFDNKNTHEDYFSYTTQGQYLKLGGEYNITASLKDIQNTIFVGGRYAVARFEQEVTKYVPHTLHRYWNEPLQGNNPNILRSYDGRQAHFLELILGMKVELLTNLYAGLSVRFGKLLYQNKNGFPNFYIPGFGRVWENSTYGVGYNYTLSYMLPLRKR